MNNQERLEDIISDLPYSFRHSGEIEQLKYYAREQAERSQELEKELNGTGHMYGYKQMYGICNSDYAHLNGINQRYRQALEFYSEGKHCSLNVHGDHLILDNGQVARDALRSDGK